MMRQAICYDDDESPTIGTYLGSIGLFWETHVSRATDFFPPLATKYVRSSTFKKYYHF
jgi:hypothetical protein